MRQKIEIAPNVHWDGIVSSGDISVAIASEHEDELRDAALLDPITSVDLDHLESLFTYEQRIGSGAFCSAYAVPDTRLVARVSHIGLESQLPGFNKHVLGETSINVALEHALDTPGYTTPEYMAVVRSDRLSLSIMSRLGGFAYGRYIHTLPLEHDNQYRVLFDDSTKVALTALEAAGIGAEQVLAHDLKNMDNTICTTGADGEPVLGLIDLRVNDDYAHPRVAA